MDEEVVLSEFVALRAEGELFPGSKGLIHALLFPLGQDGARISTIVCVDASDGTGWRPSGQELEGLSRSLTLASCRRRVYSPLVARELTHVVSFRTSASEHRKLSRARDTMDEGGWRDFFVWLMNEPAVKSVIDERLATHSPAGIDGKSWGLDASLPVGDREPQVRTNGRANNGVRAHVTSLSRGIDGVLLLEVQVDGEGLA